MGALAFVGASEDAKKADCIDGCSLSFFAFLSLYFLHYKTVFDHQPRPLGFVTIRPCSTIDPDFLVSSL